MKAPLIFAWVAGGSVAALYAYAYYQNGGPPALSDVEDVLTSFWNRGSAIVTNAAGDVTGTSSYMDAATALIAKLEGFRAKTYPDAGGLSIGYGHHLVSGDGFDANSVISESDAWALLQADLQTSDACIGSSVSVDLTNNQRAALLSFVYNVGCGAFERSTLLSDINSGNFDGAASQFGAWIYSTDANGIKSVNQSLVARRQQESGLFTS